MRQNLLETYSRQINVAEAYVAKNFDGKQVSNNTKLTTAVLLDNTNRFMTESMVAGGQRSDLGEWKKFCLNLTNIAVPSLIANDLVIVHPMTSFSGNIAYLRYVAATEKGEVKVGDEFNSVFGLGKMSESRQNYTAQLIVDRIKTGEKIGLTCIATNKFGGEGEHKDAKLVKVSDNSVTYFTAAELNSYVANDEYKVYYFSKEFQMETVPAEQIPSIKPIMERIALVAEPRRIAVKYDQITAYQAKTDYGFSLDKQIAEQACGELAYEIDTEIVDMLYKGCPEDKVLTWSKVLPVGVSKFEHYNGFLEVVEQAKAIVYNRTQKWQPNYMVIASNVLPILRFVNGFNAAKVGKMNGPYKVGELDGLSVYVSPLMGSGEFFLGLNGSDMMSSAGVYAPYMAIVPTQLLGTPDGALQQGFSTYYAKALLNKNLLVKGKITDIDVY